MKKTGRRLIIFAFLICLALAMAPMAAAALIAEPTSSSVLVNGRPVAFDAYNIEGNNYFKLRDLAYILNGTQKQFEIGWDSANNAISLTRGRPYTAAGGEMAGKGSDVKMPTPTSSKITLDGIEVRFTAYNIDGNNYFKLRDIGQAFDFGVDWEAAGNAIVIDTGREYTPEGVAPLPAFGFDTSKAIPASKLLEYYNLSAAERRLYDQLAAGLASFELRIEVDASPQNDEDINKLSKVCNILYFTHPEIFWWGANVMFTTDGRPFYDGKYYLLPIYIADGKTLHADIYGAYNTMVYPSADEIAAAKAWVQREKAAIRDKLNQELPVRSGMTPFELEVAVYEWLGDVLTYDANYGSKHELDSIHGALIGGRAVCMGYARTFQYIMNLLGVESVMLLGYAGESHAWNAVKLGGEWYQLDVTSDGTARKRDNLPWHLFLNRTDKFMADMGFTKEEDVPFYENPDITCTATKYNYYMFTNSYIASDADFMNDVPARIARAKRNGERAFDLEFARNYAKPTDIYDKISLIGWSYIENIDFWVNPNGLLFGVFKEA